MLNRLGIIVALAGLISAPAAGQNRNFPFEDPQSSALAIDRLERFGSDEAFRAYVEAVDQATTLRHARRRAGSSGGDKQKPSVFAGCESDDDMCDVITVTGSSIRTPNPIITNNQEIGVDEGDIVKQIGDHLVVLQDGRLFSVSLQPGGASPLEFADRLNVYTDPERDIWYDEMLVSGNRVVVIGYAYRDSASELTLLEMNESGVFTRLDAFQIASNDYYDPENYASRMVGGQLVLHIPIIIEDIDLDEDRPWPELRRWYPRRERPAHRGEALQLFDAASIFRPLQGLAVPVIHSITVCDIDGYQPGQPLDCAAEAFIGPARAEFYITPSHAYLWSSPGWDEVSNWQFPSAHRTCPAGHRAALAQTLPSRIHRLDLESGQLEVAAVRGAPVDQFGMQAANGRFRALVDWNDPHCRIERYGRDSTDFALLDLPEARFGQTVEAVLETDYTALPSALEAGDIENRFTASHLVYGWTSGGLDHVPQSGEQPRKSGYAAILSLADPGAAMILRLPYELLRMEVMGENIITTGYRHTEGLHLSHIALGATPRITDSTVLEGRFETEGRSHAFNSLVRPDGSGVLGIPTLFAPVPGYRWWWRSAASDLSFLALDAEGQLSVMGSLSAGDVSERPSEYSCDVSCIDWYGNSRPIFTNDRIFALSATDLIEGMVTGNELKGVFRVDLTAAAPAGSMAVGGTRD